MKSSFCKKCTQNISLLHGAFSIMLFGIALAGCTGTAPPGKESIRDDPMVISQDEEQIDRMQLAARLIQGGNYGRAHKTLEQVDLSDETADQALYYWYRGIVAYNLGMLKDACAHFTRAVEKGKDEPEVFLFMAQAYYGLNDYRSTLNALDRAGEEAQNRPEVFRIRIHCRWELGQKAAAIGAIQAAEKRFPEEHEFTKQKILYLIHMRLYREAADISRGYIQKAGDSPNVYLAVGEALRRSRQYDDALKILEQARFTFPDNDKIVYSLAHAYMDSGRFLPAARMFEKASLRNPDFLPEAVELYRKAGKHSRALSLNAEILDQKKKTRQRLSILIEQQRFEGAVTLESRLVRLNLLEDENICYALAYAYFKTGGFDRAKYLLARITSKDLFANVIKLREAIEVYAQSEWQIP